MNEQNEQNEQNENLRAYPIHEKNPYMPNLIVPYRNKTVTLASEQDWALINTDTGEAKNLVLAVREKIDKQEFVKIYKSQIQSIFKLSGAGIKIFGYIMSCLNINSDMIILDIKEACNYTGYKTRPPIYKAVVELLKHKFIARTSKPNVFFINPAVFFNGKRFTIVKAYEIEIKKESESKMIDMVNNTLNEEKQSNLF